MPRTLSDDLAADVTNAFLADFAESVMYYPKSGAARSVTADFRRRGSFPNDGDGGIASVEVGELRVARTATGIDSPQIGDRLLPTGDSDYWHWEGEMGQVSSAMWTLIFTRETQYRVGGNLLR